MDYGFDSENFKNYSRVINYYNDLEEFLISIKHTLSFFEYELDNLYTQSFNYFLTMQEEDFLILNKGRNLSLFHSIFPQFYNKKDINSFKEILRFHYQGVDDFLSYQDFIYLIDVNCISELEQKTSNKHIIDLIKRPLFLSIKNKNQEQRNTCIYNAFKDSKLAGISYHESFESVSHFDNILKEHFIFINKFEYQLKSDHFDSGLVFFKALVELGFKQYFKTSSFPQFKSLGEDYSKKQLLEVLNADKDLSIYHLPDNFNCNKYYLLSHIYQYSPLDLTEKLLEKYPLNQEMIDYLNKHNQLENTAFSKFLLKYKLEENLYQNKGKSFNKI